MKRMMKKLRSRAGESIGETLVALLISSLALVMLAGAIGSAARMVTRSMTAMEAYYATDKSMAERAGSSRAGTGSVTMSTAAGIDRISGSYAVNYYQNELGSTAVFSYAPSGD